MEKLTSDDMNLLDVITVNELEPVLFTDIAELVESNLEISEKVLYLNRLINFKDMNDNTLSELYGVLKNMHEDALLFRTETGEIALEIDCVIGTVHKEGIKIV